MYLAFVAINLVIAYFVLHLLFSLFFRNKIGFFGKPVIASVVLIAIFSFVINYIALSISDEQLSNRVLHAFGGGFIAFLICFLVVRDSSHPIGKLQFFIFSFLVVMTMGIINEIIEFYAQNYSNLIFAPTVNDTWLDLISNAVGALIGGIVFTPFIRR